MFQRYIHIKENKIVCGQTSAGIWYCKELPADNAIELQILVGEVNKILNNYNAQTKKKKKENTTEAKIKGLK